MSNQVPSITLQTAIIMQVTEFAEKNEAFSIHDITRVIRTKVFQGSWEIPETEVSGASFRFDIPHAKIKTLFLDLLQTGTFDANISFNRNYNGTYFVYTPTLLNTPASVNQPTPTSQPTVSVTNVTQTPTSTTSTPTAVSDAEVQSRIETYLNNCAARNFRPTLKQVQSAIKRNVSTGWSCQEIQSYVEDDLGYTIVPDPNFASAAQVVTV